MTTTIALPFSTFVALFAMCLPVLGQVIRPASPPSRIEPIEIQARQTATLSIGDKLGWDIAAIPQELELSNDQKTALSKVFRQRLDARERAVQDCIKELENMEKADKSAVDDSISQLKKSESKLERTLTDQIDEILSPKQFEALVQMLIRQDQLGFAEITACAEHLDLTELQRRAFIEARENLAQLLLKRAEKGEDNNGVIADPKIGETAMAPVRKLSRTQLEKYLHAQGIVKQEKNLEEYFRDASPDERMKLKKIYPVFKLIEEEVDNQGARPK